MATKMSKEEKAVRDALAAVLADTGVQQAQAAIASAPSNQAASTSGKISDIDTSTPLGKAATEILGKAQTFVDKNTPTAPTAPVVTPVVNQGLTAEQIAANNATQLIKQQQEAQDAANFANRKSAYDLLFQQFSQYGLGSLVEPLKDLVQQNVSPSEFTIRLQSTDAYKKRFSANADRISKGLSALNPAEYIALEDQYQNIMRNYGLPSSYYAKDSMGTQAGFNQLLANDVSASELEDRITTGQSRVINASPEVKQALRQFYPNITDGDILAYVLDPTKALVDIKRKVTASEIGGAAIQQGLNTNVTTAEDLAAYGVNRQQAITGYQNVASVLPTASKLSNIYGEANVDYTQSTAEQEFLKNNVLASQKRAQLTNLETAQFGGSAGVGSAGLSTQMLRKSSSAGQY